MKTIWNRVRIPLLEWYFVAAVCYFCMIGLDMDILVVAIIIGFVNTYLVAPIVIALSDNGEEIKKEYYEQAPKTLKNVLKSAIICLSILGIFYLVNEFLFPTAVNPYIFGLLYWLLGKTLACIFKKWK